MTIAVCPRCGEPVQIPAVSGGTTVACPLCQSEYRLDEVLSKLPPTLRVVESPSASETPTVSLETDSSSLTRENPTVVVESEPAANSDFADEAPAVSFMDEPPAITSEDAEPTPASFDFDSGNTTSSSPVDGGVGSTMAYRTASRRRNVAVEFLKIALGGVAGLAIAQALLWWLPGGFRKDPLGLAPRLPSQLAFLAPASLREPAIVNGDPSTSTPTRDSAAPGQDGVDLQRAFEAAQADSQSVREPQIAQDRGALGATGDATGTSDATTAGGGNLGDSVQPAEHPADESVEGLLGIRSAPSFSAAEITDSLVPVEDSVADWVGGQVTDHEARLQLARRLFEEFYQVAWKATFADSAAKESGSLQGRVTDVLWMISKVKDNIELIGAAAASWLATDDGSNRGILLSGTVRSIDAQGAYFASTIELSGRKELTVAVVSPSDPSFDARGGYQVGDKIVLLGAIVVDPSLDILGYEGNADMVIWAGPRIVLVSPAAGE